MMSGESVQIVFRGMPHSDALEARIRGKARKLAQFFPFLIGCRVVAEVPYRGHGNSSQFVVRLDVAVPGGEIVVNREDHEDIRIALREAFRAARRQLKGCNGRQRAREGASATMEPQVVES
jgi:ribosome-associated translation inhibitor RaiA